MFDLNGPRTLRCSLASAFYWVWIFLLIWDTPLSVTGSGSLSDSWLLFVAKGMFLIGAVISIVVIHALRGKDVFRFGGGGPLYALVCVASSLTGICSIFDLLGYGVPLPFVLLSWFAGGLASAFILVQCNRAMATLDMEFGRTILFLSGFIACLIGLFTSLISVSSPIAATVLTTCFPWLGFACSFVAFSNVDIAQDRVEEHEAVDDDVALEDPQLKSSFRKFQLQMFFYSVVFSFVLFVNLSTDIQAKMTVWIWLGVFAASLLIMVYVTWLNQHLRIDMLQWALLIAVAVVLPLAYLSLSVSALLPVCCTIMMFSFTAYDQLSLSQLSSFISVNHVSFIRYFTLGRLSNAGGVAVGWLLAAIAIYLSQVAGNYLVVQVFPIALLAVFVVLISLFSVDNYWNGIRTANVEAKKEATGSWKRACDAISSENGLSAREHEVFILCAKGRDSVFISDVLYISVHTVKSHIYHIYQKIDVHSQQELISLVEQRASVEKGL